MGITIEPLIKTDQEELKWHPERGSMVVRGICTPIAGGLQLVCGTMWVDQLAQALNGVEHVRIRFSDGAPTSYRFASTHQTDGATAMRVNFLHPRPDAT
jgi:hypothetical protein